MADHPGAAVKNETQLPPVAGAAAKPQATNGANANANNAPNNRHFCQWDACDKQFFDLDSLVGHLMTEHIKSRQSKYKCEWRNCSRNGIIQPSRFALVSHVRSHTGEKPYYCIIPECARKFTRSDALAKHMRTVHDANPSHGVDSYPWWYQLKHELLKDSPNYNPSVHAVRQQNGLKKDLSEDPAADSSGPAEEDQEEHRLPGKKRSNSSNRHEKTQHQIAQEFFLKGFVFLNDSQLPKNLEFARNSRKRYYDAMEKGSSDNVEYSHALLFTEAPNENENQNTAKPGANGTSTGKANAHEANGIADSVTTSIPDTIKHSNPGSSSEIEKLTRIHKQLQLYKNREAQQAIEQQMFKKSQQRDILNHEEHKHKQDHPQDHPKGMQINSMLNSDDQASRNASPQPEAASDGNGNVVEKPKRMKLLSILELHKSEPAATTPDDIDIINQDSEDEKDKINQSDDEEIVKLINDNKDPEALALKFKEKIISDFNLNLGQLNDLLTTQTLNNEYLASIYSKIDIDLEVSSPKTEKKFGKSKSGKGKNKTTKAEKEEDSLKTEISKAEEIKIEGPKDDGSATKDVSAGSAKEEYQKLKRYYLWSLEVNQLLRKDLIRTTDQEKRFFLYKEALVNANLQLELGGKSATNAEAVEDGIEGYKRYM